MLTKTNLFIGIFMAFAVYLVNFSNEKMAFLELDNSSTFESYMRNRKKLLSKYHPDSTNESSTSSYEKIQELDKLFNTGFKFRQKFMDLFVFGDIDENTLNKYKIVFRKMTQVIIIVALLCCVIFAKLVSVKRQIFSFALMIITLLPFSIIFYGQYLYIFYGDASIFLQLRTLIQNSELLKQTTISEVINFTLSLQILVVCFFVLLITPVSQPLQDYNKLFATLLITIKAITSNPASKLAERQESLRNTITSIDEALPKESVAWRRVQKVFNLISIGLLVYSLISNR